MACRWIEGFETHRIITQLVRKYASATGTSTSQAGRVFGSAVSPGSGGLILVTPAWGLRDTVILGFGFKMTSHTTAVNSGSQGWYLEKAGAEQFHIKIESGSGLGFRFLVKRGATVLYTSDYVAFDTWAYIEIKAVAKTGTAGSFEIRNNGTTLTTQTGINLAAAGSDGVDGFALRVSANNTSPRFDDIYVLDDTGGAKDDFLGPQTVEGVEVTANGATNSWTNDAGSGSNFQNVDDAGTSAPDESGAGGTNSSDTNGQKDFYVMSDLVETTGTINAIMVEAQLAMASAGTRTVRPVFDDAVGGEGPGANMVVDSTAYDGFTQIFEENPGISAPWTLADLNAGEWGMEVVS
jgi:hypothetical protein